MIKDQVNSAPIGTEKAPDPQPAAADAAQLAVKGVRKQDEPQTGGSYIRNPATGELTRVSSVAANAVANKE